MLPAEHLADLFAAVGPIQVRRLFGGQGIFCRGVMIALVGNDVLFLRTDEETRPRFEAAGAEPFVHAGKTGRVVRLPYWSVPDAALDDPEAFAAWGRLACEAAIRQAAGKPPRRRRRSPPSSRQARD